MTLPGPRLCINGLGRCAMLKQKSWIQKRAARPLNLVPKAAASACLLQVHGSRTPTQGRTKNISWTPTAPTIAPFQLSSRKNWRWIISWILTNSQAAASLPLCSATEEQPVLLTGKFCPAMPALTFSHLLTFRHTGGLSRKESKSLTQLPNYLEVITQ